MNEGHQPPGETSGSPRRPPQRLAGPLLAFDLADEVTRLRAEETWQHGGRNAKTLVKEPDFRIVLIALRRGGRLDEHRAPARISIQTLAGRLRLRVAERTLELPTGQLVTLERDVAHAVDAVEESAFLLTIAWTGEHGGERHFTDE